MSNDQYTADDGDCIFEKCDGQILASYCFDQAR